MPHPVCTREQNEPPARTARSEIGRFPRSRWQIPLLRWAAFLLLSLPASLSEAQQTPPPRDTQKKNPDVTELDIEDLMNVRVTSPGRKEQQVTKVPAAIYVIRGEDIRRTGATSIAEALRGVPGVQVARQDGNTWAISARGFNSTSSNKLLVLIDGRSVYSPLQSGVFWDVQDTFLEDIERIEVIRGPGGTLWGNNAINGVINVITKPVEDTSAGYFYGGLGTEEVTLVGARYTQKVSDHQSVRFYAKHFERDDLANGVDDRTSAHDDWTMSRTGFRTDIQEGTADRLIVMGDCYQGQVEERSTLASLSGSSTTYTTYADLRGNDLLVRWEHESDAATSYSLQAYYDHTYRAAKFFRDIVHTADLDFEYHVRAFENHDFNFGLGYRYVFSDFHGHGGLLFSDPQTHHDDIPSAYLQDEIALSKDLLNLTLGAKLEHNDYSGLETQPSVRMTWTPNERETVWFAASRAVRTPTIVDVALGAEIPIAGGTPTLFRLTGNPDFKPEELVALEAGYRVRPADPVYCDLALFYHSYDDLRSTETGTAFLEATPAPAHFVLPVSLENEYRGRTWGVEPSVSVELEPGWRLQANYSFLRMNLVPTHATADKSTELAEDENPRNQVWVRSSTDLPDNLFLDVVVRYVDNLPRNNISSYVDADIRIASRDADGRREVALVGQNLLHASHAEFGTRATRSEVQRGVYLVFTWRF